MSVIIGIDTSCYTTSISVVDTNEDLLKDCRKVLDVKKGNRGLRQSEAVFQHMNNLPNLFLDLFSSIDKDNVSGICVSSKPRPVEDSYMPVFTVATNIGSIISSTLNIPLLQFSHQEGHIRAGIWSSGGPNSDEFLCIHLSGGTTEILNVRRNNINFDIDIIGGTMDISAGQLIDRVGVMMGLDFPCGRELEKLAQNGQDIFTIPSSVRGLDLSFSGAETLVKNKYNEYSENDIAYAVQKCIAKTLDKVIKNAINKYKNNNILMVGGVASNKFIRNFFNKKLPQCKLFFGKPEYSVDNSVGIALMGVDYAKTNFNSK